MGHKFDVVIIGAGPAGYVAAIRCSQLGLKTACIDNWINKEGRPVLGGTCLNVGCIPSKALLESSELYHRSISEFSKHGISAKEIKLNLPDMLARKEGIVKQLTGGIETLFGVNKVTWLKGQGYLIDSQHVQFTPHGKETDAENIEASNIIIASGSKSIDLETAPLDHEYIVDSTGALSFEEVPKKICIVGAGVIGLELGSVWNRLGSEVVILEAQDLFLSMVDQQIAKAGHRELKKQGLDIRLNARVISTKISRKKVTVQYLIGDEEAELKVDRLILAVGREPNTQNLFAPESGLLLDERCFIHVDDNCATNLPGVYAIGDVVRGPMLAHKGSDEGMAVAEALATGVAVPIAYDKIPSVVYTHPEIAWVGQSEQQLKSLGVPIKVGVFPFAASGRAQANSPNPPGMVKMIANADTDQILGVHIIGPSASELIAEAVLAMEYQASSEDLARTIHAHPTLSESLREAALAVEKRAIHIQNTKK